MRKTVTKRMILTLIMVFSMYCLVACGGETQNEVISDNNNGLAINNETDKPEATVEPTEEPSSEVVESTADPMVEATPEPTEEPSVVYEGIDMDSTLNGQDWLETFVGVIDEPKVVVFSDITGKKVIVEQEGEVTINPDEDAMALYFPAGYANGNVSSGVARDSDTQIISTENYEIFYLDAEKMREVEKSKAGFWVMKGEEKIVLIVHLIIE